MASIDLNKAAGSARGGRLERRNRVRTPLRWPIVLFRSSSGEAIETVTENLSSSGFYCFTRVPLAVGEFLSCAMKVPTNDPRHHELDCQLDCKVQVVRVEPVEGKFGIAVRIESYHFVHTT